MPHSDFVGRARGPIPTGNAHLLVLLLTRFAVVASASTSGIAAGRGTNTKKQAEATSCESSLGSSQPGRCRVVNPRHSCADDTEAIRHGRGSRRTANRYTLVCAVRPEIPTARQDLYELPRATGLPVQHPKARLTACTEGRSSKMVLPYSFGGGGLGLCHRDCQQSLLR